MAYASMGNCISEYGHSVAPS